jgi:Zn-dependent protease with chaperone function
MDFFEAQAKAKKRTGWLVFLFVLAVIGTMLAAYTAALLISLKAGGGEFEMWDPGLFAGTSLAVLGIVGLASMVKWSQFSAGGSAVAEMVGGRRLSPGSADLNERRLLNVVEEMAIASGLPVPAVYVLDDEEGINAFAAGLTGGDAIVAVTRGTLNRLNRDELQGVVAHEFSHILNGDMRMNVRLSAILFGILVLGLLGRGILSSLGRTRVRSSDKKGGGVAVVLAAGLAMMIIGYVGYFFGRLIQAAVSRQREFLADASAVQFTRNPSGIAGALRKIGGSEEGSIVNSGKAPEIGHFFFAQGYGSWFNSIFATHPPLDERIRAIDPSWDGRFVNSAPHAPSGAKTPARREDDEDESSIFGAEPPLVAAAAPIAFSPATVVHRAGTITEEHFRNAQSLLAQVPAELRQASRASDDAEALVLAVLGAGDPAHLVQIETTIRSRGGEALARKTVKLAELVGACPASVRLSLVQLSVPTLRALDEAAATRLLSLVEEVSRADGMVSALEMAASKLLTRSLLLSRKPATQIQFYSFQAVAKDIDVVLSTLAHVGNEQESKAREALATGLAQLKLIEAQLDLLPSSECSLARFSQSLDRLAVASLPIKKRLLVAAAYLIGADGQVTPAEAELYRAVAAAIDCPMPVWEQAA